MRPWAVTVPFVFLWAGCGSSDNPGPSEGEKACQELQTKLQGCGLSAVCDPSDPCPVHCAIDADCNEIIQKPTTGAYMQCVAACAGGMPGDFICKDGKRVVKKIGVCNGQYDCQDGSDEENCGVKDAGKD
jgi:hypothetical protein